MDELHYKEMLDNVLELEKNHKSRHSIIVFGHCNASENLVDVLLERGFSVRSILDNNKEKQGENYRGIPIVEPETILSEDESRVIVCIVTRFFEEMKLQLKTLGFQGEIYKLIDYNTFSEYSLSDETINKKLERVNRGINKFNDLKSKYVDYFCVFCPFSALGDIFIMMSYLPYFLGQRGVKKCVIAVVGNACAQVAHLFITEESEYQVEVLSQKDMDEMIQAVLYTGDKNAFIAHQDRPYVINLHKALYTKCIPLEQIYCCGVLGLPMDTEPYKPARLDKYASLDSIEENNSVIFSPYAKSVTTFEKSFWKPIVEEYSQKGFRCFTNVVGDEKPLDGTLPISPSILEMQSVVERAGHFVGIRSGLCDVIRYADCKKIALYPDYYYSDTKWKAIDMYYLEGWKNIVVGDDFRWKS